MRPIGPSTTAGPRSPSTPLTSRITPLTIYGPIHRAAGRPPPSDCNSPPPASTAPPIGLLSPAAPTPMPPSSTSPPTPSLRPPACADSLPLRTHSTERCEAPVRTAHHHRRPTALPWPSVPLLATNTLLSPRHRRVTPMLTAWRRGAGRPMTTPLRCRQPLLPPSHQHHSKAKMAAVSTLPAPCMGLLPWLQHLPTPAVSEPAPRCGPWPPDETPTPKPQRRRSTVAILTGIRHSAHVAGQLPRPNTQLPTSTGTSTGCPIAIPNSCHLRRQQLR